VIENKLIIDVDETKEVPIASLVALGHEKGFVTYDDILGVIPEVEQDQDHLEMAFAALISAGIRLNDDDENDSTSNEKNKLDGASNPDETNHHSENPLRNIDSSDLVGLYFNDAARHPLLTAQEEVDLAKRIERGCEARKALSNGNGLSPEQKRELQALADDGWSAVETLITANSRLVISVAKKYVGRGVAFLDLIQEGNIGLMRAAKKYEYRRGFKFSTYATWWIRQAITRALADQGRTIRVPVHMSERLTKMFRTQHELRQDLGRDPKIEEIAVAMQVSPSRIQYLMRVARHPLSLETPTMLEGDAVLGDFIEDVESPDPDETATHSLLRQQLEHALEELPPREVRILKMRFGLSDGKKYTLRETGDKMGVTRERIRQIEATALRRVRQPQIRRKFRGYFQSIGTTSNELLALTRKDRWKKSKVRKP
jgi:RNA polymerase primary sigma factor